MPSPALAAVCCAGVTTHTVSSATTFQTHSFCHLPSALSPLAPLPSRESQFATHPIFCVCLAPYFFCPLFCRVVFPSGFPLSLSVSLFNCVSLSLSLSLRLRFSPMQLFFLCVCPLPLRLTPPPPSPFLLYLLVKSPVPPQCWRLPHLFPGQLVRHLVLGLRRRWRARQQVHPSTYHYSCRCCVTVFESVSFLKCSQSACAGGLMLNLWTTHGSLPSFCQVVVFRVVL